MNTALPVQPDQEIVADGVVRENAGALEAAHEPDIGDLMRYAAQVTFAEMTDFGPHHMLSPETRRVQARLPDESLYALALYIYSLKPPPNPNPSGENAKAGERVFTREGCPGCHTPPLDTNNKVTLALGFTPPTDKAASIDGNVSQAVEIPPN